MTGSSPIQQEGMSCQLGGQSSSPSTIGTLGHAVRPRCKSWLGSRPQPPGYPQLRGKISWWNALPSLIGLGHPKFPPPSPPKPQRHPVSKERPDGGTGPGLPVVHQTVGGSLWHTLWHHHGCLQMPQTTDGEG